MEGKSDKPFIEVVAKTLGIVNYPEYEDELCLFTSSALVTLKSLGVPLPVTSVTPNTLYGDVFLVDDTVALATFAMAVGIGPDISQGVKTSALYPLLDQYIYMYLRLNFDPPATAHLNTALQERLEELTWRIKEEVAMEESVGLWN